MAYIGKVPTAVPLTTSDLADGIVTVDKLATTLDLSGNTITLPSGVGGKILQVVSGLTTFSTSTTSTSFVDVLSASATTWETSITLSSSSNKVLILPNVHCQSDTVSSPEARYTIITLGKIGSGSYTQIGDSGTATRFGTYDYGDSGAIIGQHYSASFLWSPNSTDELKFKFQMKTGAGSLKTSRDGFRSVVNLLEVAG